MYELKQMSIKMIYQLRMISGQLEIKVIYAKPVFDNVEFFSVSPVVN